LGSPRTLIGYMIPAYAIGLRSPLLAMLKYQSLQVPYLEAAEGRNIEILGEGNCLIVLVAVQFVRVPDVPRMIHEMDRVQRHIESLSQIFRFPKHHDATHIYFHKMLRK
jgi:hypothetical protein